MPTLVLLAFTDESVELLRRGLAGRLEADTTRVRGVEGTLAQTIEGIRRELGPVPIGLAARTEPEAIEGLEAGADEALVVSEHDPTTVTALIDRARVRGHLRASDANAKVNVAQADKLAALGTLVAGVAHEINNPLAALMLTLDVFPTGLAAAAEAVETLRRAREEGRGLTYDDVRRAAALSAGFGSRQEMQQQLADLRTTASTIGAVVRDLLTFASPHERPGVDVVDLPALIEPILRVVGRELSANAIVERDYAPDVPPVLASSARLTQVLTNVIVNATHALREVPREVHHVRIALRADEEAVAISVSDTGPGIPPEAVERIFDPFFTTKRLNLGTGLGLSISRNLMRKMGGDLLVESVFGAGATFIILLKRSSEVEIRAARIQTRTVPSRAESAHRPAVMVVQEESALARAYSRVLAPRFDLMMAGDSEEAVEMISSGSAPDVVLADLGLSPTDGAHLFRWLSQHRPDLASRMVFVADQPDLPRHRDLLQENAILPKPTPAAVLLEAVSETARRSKPPVYG